MTLLLELDTVSKKFDSTVAIQGLSTSIHTGDLIGLLGPDGAGKTTLMRLMAGLMKPTSGQIHWHFSTSSPKESIGYMPQRFGLYEDLSIRENIELSLRLKNIPLSSQPKIIPELLETTGLAPFMDRLAGHLSGGMKQKLALISCIVGNPSLLLLDEPGVGVDPVSREDLRKIVYHLIDIGIAVVWATSYLEEAEYFNSVLLIERGDLKFKGMHSELTEQIKDRCFLLRGQKDHNRFLIRDLLDLPAVCDAVIQGDAIRMVLHRDYYLKDIASFLQSSGFRVEKTLPRFEDAYVDLLGGSPKGTSPLEVNMLPIYSENEYLVECENLSKKFGEFTAVQGISFRVKKGEIFGLLGPNGAGKSVTFKMLCGLIHPTTGYARVAGYDFLKSYGSAKEELGYMAQKFSLYSLLSVEQNLHFAAGIYGMTGIKKDQCIRQMIDTFQLESFLDTEPEQLPLGFKQRLALACALMHRPSVLFLDEPTSGVDPITRREFWIHINGLVRQGTTVIVTTHFMEEAEYCDRLALMYHSQLIALDTPDALKKKFWTPGQEMPTMEETFIHMINKFNVSSQEESHVS